MWLFCFIILHSTITDHGRCGTYPSRHSLRLNASMIKQKEKKKKWYLSHTTSARRTKGYAILASTLVCHASEKFSLDRQSMQVHATWACVKSCIYDRASGGAQGLRIATRPFPDVNKPIWVTPVSLINEGRASMFSFFFCFTILAFSLIRLWRHTSGRE